jgi:hypothetical protein
VSIFLSVIVTILSSSVEAGKLDGADALFFNNSDLHKNCRFFSSYGLSSFVKIKNFFQHQEKKLKPESKPNLVAQSAQSYKPPVSSTAFPPLNQSKSIEKTVKSPSLCDQNQQTDSPPFFPASLEKVKKISLRDQNQQTEAMGLFISQQEKNEIREILSLFQSTVDLLSEFEGETILEQAQNAYQMKEKLMQSQKEALFHFDQLQKMKLKKEALIQQLKQSQHNQKAVELELTDVENQKKNLEIERHNLKIQNNEIKKNLDIAEQNAQRKQEAFVESRQHRESHWLNRRCADLERQIQNLETEQKDSIKKLCAHAKTLPEAIDFVLSQKPHLVPSASIRHMQTSISALEKSDQSEKFEKRCADLERQIQNLETEQKDSIKKLCAHAKTLPEAIDFVLSQKPHLVPSASIRYMQTSTGALEKSDQSDKSEKDAEQDWEKIKSEYRMLIADFEKRQKKAQCQISENAENLEQAIDQISAELSVFSGKDLLNQMRRFKEVSQKEHQFFIDENSQLQGQIDRARTAIQPSCPTLPEATQHLKDLLSPVSGANLSEKIQNCLEKSKKLIQEVKLFECTTADNEDVQKKIDQEAVSLKSAVSNLEDLLNTFMGKDLVEKTKSALQNTRELVEQVIALEFLLSSGNKELVDPTAETEKDAFENLKKELFDFGSGSMVKQVQEAKSQLQDLKTQIGVLDQIIKSAKKLINPCASTLGDAITHAQRQLSKFGSESLTERILKVLQHVENLEEVKINLNRELLKIQLKIDPEGLGFYSSIEKAKKLLKDFGMEDPLMSQVKKAVSHIQTLNDKIQSYDEAQKKQELEQRKKEEKFAIMLEKIEAYEKNASEKLGLTELGGSGTWTDRVHAIHKKIDEKMEDSILNSVAALMDNRMFSFGDIHAGNGSIRLIVQAMKKKGLDTKGIDDTRVDLSSSLRNMILAFQKLSQGVGEKGKEKSALAVWNDSQKKYVPVNLRMDGTLSNVLLRLLEAYDPVSFGSIDIIMGAEDQ